MPTVTLSPGVRLALYVLSGLGSLVVAYLFAKGLVGEAETALWAGVVALVNAVAAANVSNRNEAGQGYIRPVIAVVVVVLLVLLILRLA